MTSSKLSGSAENFYFLNTSSPRTSPFLWEKKNEIEIMRKMTDDGLGLELNNVLKFNQNQNIIQSSVILVKLMTNVVHVFFLPINICRKQYHCIHAEWFLLYLGKTFIRMKPNKSEKVRYLILYICQRYKL